MYIPLCTPSTNYTEQEVDGSDTTASGHRREKDHTLCNIVD